MTIEQFVTELEKVRDDYVWKISDGFIKGIRGTLKKTPDCWCCRHEFCPITAVTKKLTSASYPDRAAAMAGVIIGLTVEDSASIMNAADQTGHDPDLFNKLVQATGVLLL